MTTLLARLRRPTDTRAFDRRLIAPMILGSLLNPVRIPSIPRSTFRLRLPANAGDEMNNRNR